MTTTRAGVAWGVGSAIGAGPPSAERQCCGNTGCATWVSHCAAATFSIEAAAVKTRKELLSSLSSSFNQYHSGNNLCSKIAVLLYYS